MSIKDKIKSTFTGKYLISELHCIECSVLPKLFDDETIVKRYYKKHTGKELNLDNPISFAEKLNWYKLYDHNPLMIKCADKYAVREYITEQGYEGLLNEIYGVYESVDQIDIDSLPEQFILKAAHGSHMNIIVKDKTKVNWKQAKLMMASWLRQDIFWSGREWCYKDVPKRIIAEGYIEDSDEELKDYKFYCYNGKPTYMQYDSGRLKQKHIRQFYDMNMNLTTFKDSITIDNEKFITINEDIYNKMKKIAEKLAEPFQFVRVDFYYANNKTYFGELTFYDGGGYSGFLTEQMDIEFAKNWVIENKQKINDESFDNYGGGSYRFLTNDFIIPSLEMELV